MILFDFPALLVSPGLLIPFLGTLKSGAPVSAAVAWMLAYLLLVATAGFVGGVIASALYNLIALLTGGLEFEVTIV